MVAKVSLGGNLYGALAYNQDKIDRGKGQVLETNRVFVPTDGRFSVAECMRDFERTMPSQVTTTRGIVHISLNPHPEDRLTDEQLTDIGREYIERMGFGNQPWMLFKHEDIDREHLHIVTTRVRGDGSLISDKNNYERSRKITDDLERKYGLHPKGERQGEAWRLAPVDASAGDLKRQVGNVVKHLTDAYGFHSLPGYRALLSLYNVGVEKVEGDNWGNRYAGLVYSVLDADGNRVGQPLKSSLFGKKYGIAHLEGRMQEVKTKGFPTSIRTTLPSPHRLTVPAPVANSGRSYANEALTSFSVTATATACSEPPSPAPSSTAPLSGKTSPPTLSPNGFSTLLPQAKRTSGLLRRPSLIYRKPP